MTDLLTSFKSDIGDKTSSEATRVGMDFGRHLGTLTGKTPNSTLARSIVNGGHEYSNTVLNSYAISGQAVPGEVKSLLNELNNLAAHSNSVAAMDDMTRIKMIGKGHKALDEQYILNRENELLSQIEGLSRGVLTEKDRLDRQNLRANVTQNEQAVIQNDINIQQSRATLEGNLIELDDGKEARTYSKMLDELSVEQISRGLEDGEIAGLGIPRGYAVNYLADRYSKLGTIAKQQEAVAPKNDPFYNIVNNKFGTRTEDLAVTNPDVLALALDNYKNGLEDGTITPSAIPQLNIPGFGDIPFSLNEVQDALTLSLESAKKLSDASGGSADTAKIIESKSNLMSSSSLLHQNILTGIVFGLGVAPGPNSPILTEINTKFADYKNNMINATSQSEIQSLTNNYQSYIKTEIAKQIKTMPEERQAAAQEIFNHGKIYSHSSSDQVLEDLSTRNMEANRAFVESEPMREAWKLINVILGADLAAAQNAASELDVTNLLGDKKEETQTPLEKIVNDPVIMEQVAEVFEGEMLEQTYALNISAQLDKLATQYTKDPKDMTPEDAAALKAINEVRTRWFGSNGGKEFSAENSVALYHFGPNTLGALTQAGGEVGVSNFMLDETGEMRLDQNGNPIPVQMLNLGVLTRQASVFSSMLTEAGVENNLASDIFSIDEAVVQEVIRGVVPTNLPQHALSFKIFAASQGNNDGLSMSVEDIVRTSIRHAERVIRDTYKQEALVEAQQTVKELGTLDEKVYGRARNAYARDLISQIDPNTSALDRNPLEQESINRAADVTPAELFELGYITTNDLIDSATASNTGE